MKKTEDKVLYEETRFGFNYGSLVIERIASDDKKGWVAIYIRTPKKRLDIIATKTGKISIYDSDTKIKLL